jgi:polyhydroxyalkanoate synthesis regulator phasin
MTKKSKQESQKEQSARFEKAVQDMIDAGELSPTEADEAMERVMKKVAHVDASSKSS